jgi:hypothetical protein
MKPKGIVPLLLAFAFVAAGAFLIVRGDTGPDDPSPDAVAPETVADAGGETASADGDADVVVYKSPTCGCCNGWVEHMREEGFEVEPVDVPEYQALADRKTEAGVPTDLGSCHTARVGGYFIEGHVPAHIVQRLLDEQPDDIRGLSVPGMPTGSPGMEGPNPQPYDVIAVRRDGSRVVYESVYPDASESR